MVVVQKKMNPDYRSSALFPIYINKDLENDIVFLNYWKKKNDLSNVKFVSSLWSSDGIILGKRIKEISEIPYASTIKVNDEFSSELNKINTNGFGAYLEIEVFFEKEPLIKYPALILNYKDKLNSSYVHSCLRKFNPGEDTIEENHKKNQTGFNIYTNSGVDNYLIFVGGTQPVYDLKFTFEDGKNKICKDLKLDNKNNNQLFEINLTSLIKGCKFEDSNLKVSIEHDSKDVFSRFYVGNYEKGKIPTLTHTFFDEQESKDPACIKNQELINNDDFYNASFSFPILDTTKFETSLASYASNTIWKGIANLEILDNEGNVIFNEQHDVDDNFFLFKTNILNVNKMCEKNKINSENKTFKASFKKNVDGQNAFPSRQKFGLNYNLMGDKSRGCNICFSPLILNDYQFNKKRSVTWGPIGGEENIVFVFMNTSIKTNKDFNNSLNIDFINSAGETLSKEFTLMNDECLMLDVKKEIYLEEHFGKDIGWCFCNTDNNFYNSWYFSVGKENIGGDHCF